MPLVTLKPKSKPEIQLDITNKAPKLFQCRNRVGQDESSLEFQQTPLTVPPKEKAIAERLIKYVENISRKVKEDKNMNQNTYETTQQKVGHQAFIKNSPRDKITETPVNKENMKQISGPSNANVFNFANSDEMQAHKFGQFSTNSLSSEERNLATDSDVISHFESRLASKSYDASSLYSSFEADIPLKTILSQLSDIAAELPQSIGVVISSYLREFDFLDKLENDSLEKVNQICEVSDRIKVFMQPLFKQIIAKKSPKSNQSNSTEIFVPKSLVDLFDQHCEEYFFALNEFIEFINHLHTLGQKIFESFKNQSDEFDGIVIEYIDTNNGLDEKPRTLNQLRSLISLDSFLFSDAATILLEIVTELSSMQTRFVDKLSQDKMLLSKISACFKRVMRIQHNLITKNSNNKNQSNNNVADYLLEVSSPNTRLYSSDLLTLEVAKLDTLFSSLEDKLNSS